MHRDDKMKFSVNNTNIIFHMLLQEGGESLFEHVKVLNIAKQNKNPEFY